MTAKGFDPAALHDSLEVLEAKADSMVLKPSTIQSASTHWAYSWL